MGTAVLYTRVSTNKEEQETSLIYQREQYTDYCKRMGYELLDVYSDVGTGTSERRPNFQRMLYDAGLDYKKSDNDGYDKFEKSKRKPKFKYIIVKDVSRYSRSVVQGVTIAEYLRDMGVYIIFEHSGVNTEKDEWESKLSMLITFAQEESRSTSRRVKFSKQYQISKEIYTPSRLSFGYTRDDSNAIVVVPVEAEAIRLTFELYKENGSYVVANQLNEKGYLYSEGKRFTGDNVIKIINNKIYAGIAVVGKSTKANVTDTHRTYLPKSEWKEIPSGLETIITMDDWKEADDKRKGRINKSSKRGAKQATNDDFYGKIYCAECGSRFTRHQGRNNDKSAVKLSYMCMTRRKQKSKDKLGDKCNVRGIAFNILDEILDKIDVRSVFNQEVNVSRYNLLINKINEESLNTKVRIADLNKQIVSLEEESNKIEDALVAQIDSQATIDRLSKRIDANAAEIKNLNKQVKSYKLPVIQTITKIVESTMKAYEGMSNLPYVPRERKLKLLDKVVIGDYDVKFEFIQPSFVNETELFNKFFPMASIEQEVEYVPFDFVIRREHKEAREYWMKIDGELDS